MKFINPFTDYGFKKIFGREVCKDLLLSFLNALLEGERVITDLAFGNKERLGGVKGGRSMIYDIFCQTQTGERIIVEMQNRGQVNFFDRMLFYASRAISEQGERGDEWDYGISAVYAVAFMNFTVKGDEKVRTDYKLTDCDDSKRRNSKLHLTFIQLPRYTNDDPEQCASTFDKWIYVLKHMETMERMPYAAQDAVFQRLEAIASVDAMPPRERRKYEAALKAYRDDLATERYSEMMRREIEEQSQLLKEQKQQLTEQRQQLTAQEQQLTAQEQQLTEQKQQLTAQKQQLTAQKRQQDDHARELDAHERKLEALRTELEAKAAELKAREEQGGSEALAQAARKMLRQGVCTETIADFTGLTTQEIERLRADLD